MNFDPFQNRENIEWTNTWIESCHDPHKKRILLIGGSVLREIRSVMSKKYSEYAFDFIGTSSSFSDPCFYNVFDAFFLNNLYQYEAVFISIGAKHCWYIHTADDKGDADEYRHQFELFVRYIKDRLVNARIVILDAPPNCIKDNPSVWDNNLNKEISSRNTMLK